jgi:hypothetical protein
MNGMDAFFMMVRADADVVAVSQWMLSLQCDERNVKELLDMIDGRTPPPSARGWGRLPIRMEENAVTIICDGTAEVRNRSTNVGLMASYAMVAFIHCMWGLQRGGAVGMLRAAVPIMIHYASLKGVGGIRVLECALHDLEAWLEEGGDNIDRDTLALMWPVLHLALARSELQVLLQRSTSDVAILPCNAPWYQLLDANEDIPDLISELRTWYQRRDAQLSGPDESEHRSRQE